MSRLLTSPHIIFEFLPNLLFPRHKKHTIDHNFVSFILARTTNINHIFITNATSSEMRFFKAKNPSMQNPQALSSPVIYYDPDDGFVTMAYLTEDQSNSPHPTPPLFFFSYPDGYPQNQKPLLILPSQEQSSLKIPLTRREQRVQLYRKNQSKMHALLKFGPLGFKVKLDRWVRNRYPFLYVEDVKDLEKRPNT